MNSSPRFWLILAAALVVVTVAVGGAGDQGPPLDPRSVSPDGARGLVETLERFGAAVTIDDPRPSNTTTVALLLVDRLNLDDKTSALEWVEDGGTLVVADATSTLSATAAGIAPAELERGDCTIEALAQATKISGRGLTLQADGQASCFGPATSPFVQAKAHGSGTIISVGGTRLFTNEYIAQHDNAWVAVTLLAPDPASASVAILGPSTFEFGEGSPTDRMAPRVNNAIVMGLASFLIYALYRMRRLGGVVDEPLPVEIRGSELVLKAGVLSERAKDPAAAGEIIRDDFLDRWRQKLAMHHASSEDLAARIAADGAIPADELDRALSASIESDEDLVAAASVLDRIDNNPKPGRNQ